MKKLKQMVNAASIAAMLPMFAHAQTADTAPLDTAVASAIDCNDDVNLSNPVCLALPRQDVTNFVPLLALPLGTGILAAAFGKGSGTVSTVSLASTPSTTN